MKNVKHMHLMRVLVLIGLVLYFVFLIESFHSPCSSPVRSDLERLVSKLGTSGIADYLKSGGFSGVQEVKYS